MDSNAKDYGSNNWDYNSQGNHWEDYIEKYPDATQIDGIWDTPYIIEGGGNKDNYPLGDFLSINQKPVAHIDSISPNPASPGETIHFNGHGSDDGSIIAWEWRANGAIISNSGDFSKTDFSSGTYTIGFRVKDNNEEWSAYVYNTLIINANQKPNAYILKPTKTTAIYGESVQFQGYGTDPDGQVIGFLWRSAPEGIYTGENSFIISNLAVGQYTIYFKVRDDDGEWSSEVSTILTILSDSPDNLPPIADAGGPYTGSVNQSITFDGSSSYDPDAGDTITSYQWDFGDGSTGEGTSTTHIYTSEDNYTIELNVIDSHGEKTSSITYVNIKAQTDSQNGSNENDDKTPGFETIFVIFAMAFILLYKKKKRKN
jgi:PKD repeat protein